MCEIWRRQFIQFIQWNLPDKSTNGYTSVPRICGDNLIRNKPHKVPIRRVVNAYGFNQ